MSRAPVLRHKLRPSRSLPRKHRQWRDGIAPLASAIAPLSQRGGAPQLRDATAARGRAVAAAARHEEEVEARRLGHPRARRAQQELALQPRAPPRVPLTQHAVVEHHAGGNVTPRERARGGHRLGGSPSVRGGGRERHVERAAVGERAREGRPELVEGGRAHRWPTRPCEEGMGRGETTDRNGAASELVRN